MNNQLISVIVPIYNVENYLKKCVQSIISQSYKNLEIILVNDGSTDSSGKLCDMIAASDDRIKVIHKLNGGLSDARNAGIDIANGEYLSFIDGDDFITPDTIEKLYNAATANNCEISVCNIMRFFEDGSTADFYSPADRPEVLAGETRFETLNQPSVCNKLFKKELFDDVRFPKGKFYEDTFVYHILAFKAKSIALTGHTGYMYLSRKDSILGEKISDRYFDCIEAIYERFSFLKKNGMDRYAYQAALSLYAAYANAQNITPTDNNRNLFEAAKSSYLSAYRYLMHSKNTNIKQRLRLFILRYMPKLHSKIY